MKEDRCGCHWSGVFYGSCKPEKKGFNKKNFFFLLQCSCTVRVKIYSGKLKLEDKILQKGAF